jgi:Enterobacteriaceae phage serine recombinase
MKIGYARVSTTDQNPALQLAALKREGCDKIFIDKASGVSRKPELDKCLKRLNTGDVLVVWKLDRLGRSLGDLIKLLDDLKGQGMKFKSLTESIDTQTPTGRAMWQMVGVLAELERSLIRERTKAGRDAAINRGVKMGRKPKLSPQQIAHARKLIENNESPKQVAQLLGVARSTLYAALSASPERVLYSREPSFGNVSEIGAILGKVKARKQEVVWRGRLLSGELNLNVVLVPLIRSRPHNLDDCQGRFAH